MRLDDAFCFRKNYKLYFSKNVTYKSFYVTYNFRKNRCGSLTI